MLQPGNCYCLLKKKPRKFKKTELKKEPPLWCPKRKIETELVVYDFADENTRSMFTFLYERYGTMCTDTSQYQIIDRYTVSFSAQDFWTTDNKSALLGKIQVPDFTVIAFDDGLTQQYFFKERDAYIYQPYMRNAENPKEDTQ